MKNIAHDVDKAYVSPYDAFFHGFDKTHAKSLSQLKEIAKHERIALLRDNPAIELEKTEIWESF